MFKYQDDWIIKDTRFDFKNEETKASVYAMSNGYLGHRGALEESDPAQGLLVGNYVNGIYDAPANALKEREIVNIQDWCSMRLFIDDQEFDLSSGQILSFDRFMDLRDAVLHRNVIWKSAAGKTIELKTQRFVSMTEKHCCLLRWNLLVHDKCNVRILSGINANVNNKHKYHFKSFRSNYENNKMYMETVTKEKEYSVGVACTHALINNKEISYKGKYIKKNNKYIYYEYSFEMDADSEIIVDKYASVYTSRDCKVSEVETNCKSEISALTKSGYQEQKEKHTQKWEKLWQNADMVIEGDAKAQIGIRFSIYHLLNSAPYHSSSVSYPARSLSGQDHRGSIFWDTEIFIAPFFIYTMPQVARNMLLYRYNTLNGARRKAKKLGFTGAYFAWESHENGDDKCHSRVFRYAKTGRLMVNHFWDAQIHVSADVSFCVWQYFEATNDIEFLLKYGCEIILEVARFYASRTKYNKSRIAYVINGVLGPDEYHELIDNNTFTNTMAKEAINIALRAIEQCNEHDKILGHKLFEKIGIDEEELKLWRCINEKIYIHQPDSETQIIEQFDGYFKLEDCSVGELKSRRITPDEYLGGVHGLCAKTQINKQADIIMLLYILRNNYSHEIKKANWEYYEPRCEHGSSLSPMAYALVAADINMMDWSYRYFLHTAFMDLEAKGLYSNHGVHPCSLAGAWLTVVHGYIGITIKGDGIHWRTPHMPQKWNKLKFAIKWHNNAIRFNYENNKFIVRVDHYVDYEEIPFYINGEKVSITTENPVLEISC